MKVFREAESDRLEALDLKGSRSGEDMGWGTSIFAMLLAFSADAFAERLRLPVTIVNVTGGAKVQDEEITSWWKKVGEVFAQCDVETGELQIRKLPLSASGDLTMYEPDSKDSIQHIHETYGGRAPLEIYLIRKITDQDYATGTSFAAWLDVKPRAHESGLTNTIWLAMDAIRDRDQKEPVKYTLLAHELTHVLTREGSHNGKQPPNQLSIYRERTDYILPEHCESIRANPMIKGS